MKTTGKKIKLMAVAAALAVTAASVFTSCAFVPEAYTTFKQQYWYSYQSKYCREIDTDKRAYSFKYTVSFGDSGVKACATVNAAAGTGTLTWSEDSDESISSDSSYQFTTLTEMVDWFDALWSEEESRENNDYWITFSSDWESVLVYYETDSSTEEDPDYKSFYYRYPEYLSETICEAKLNVMGYGGVTVTVSDFEITDAVEMNLPD